MTRFWLKKPKVCFAGVAVRPTRKASKYSSDLPPEGVDGAVALVDEDDVEELGRDGRVVDDRHGVLRARRRVEGGGLLVVGSSSSSPFSIEYRRWMVVMTTWPTGSMVFGEALDVVELGELPAVVGRA